MSNATNFVIQTIRYNGYLTSLQTICYTNNVSNTKNRYYLTSSQKNTYWPADFKYFDMENVSSLKSLSFNRVKTVHDNLKCKC